ncbi:Hint domain-containing protein [Phycobacter sp. K97]|uniref:Hint domain-containing protein n=1 Tax=Phycobacter sedimenti TaxID=3133977 RepID=UPI00311DA7FC
MFDWFQKRSGGAQEMPLPMVSVGQGGFMAGTHVASNLGWRPIEALAVGDEVLTFDHGMQPIVELGRETLLMSEELLDAMLCPLLVPRDALNNRVPMYLMPDQGVLIESDLVEDVQGDPFAIVPACALDGYRGIQRLHPGARMELIVPRFAQDQVIYLEAGFLGYAPAQRDLVADPTGEELYSVLSHKDARDLVLAMISNETCSQISASAPHSPTGFPFIS